MHSKPSNFAQAFLTLVGLGLLVLAVFLNHYHPHNAGIATTSHGNIYQLNLDVHQMPVAENDRLALVSDVTSHQTTPGTPGVASIAPAIVTTAAATTAVPIPIAPASNSINESSTDQPSDQCSMLDKTQYAEALKAFAKSRVEYLKSVKESKDDYQSSDTNNDNRASTYYQTYLNALASAYSNYQLALLKISCQPSQPAPQGFDQ